MAVAIFSEDSLGTQQKSSYEPPPLTPASRQPSLGGGLSASVSSPGWSQQVGCRASCGEDQGLVRQPQYIWDPAPNQVPGDSAVRTPVGTFLIFISHLLRRPDLRVHAPQMPDAGSDSPLSWVPCPISARAWPPSPASLSTFGPHASPPTEISMQWGRE